MKEIILRYLNLHKFLSKNENSSIFIIIVVMAYILIIIGYSLTVPTRGQILFGANFANNQDGARYAKKALQILGEDEKLACAKVENQWRIWGNGNSINDFCIDPQNEIADQYYNSRILYPALSALLIPFMGLNSLIFWSLFIFTVTLVIQIKFLRALRLSLASCTLAILTIFSSPYYLNNSLSTAATDLILSFLVLILFYFVYQNLNIWVLSFITITISTVSTINKQNQIFWIIFSLTILTLTKFYPLINLKKFRLISFILLFTQIISIFVTEKIWNNISIARDNNLGLTLDNEQNLSTFLSLVFKLVINDLATISTKNISTFIMFIAYFSIIYLYSKNSFKNRIHDYRSSVINIYLIACGIACLANAIIIGVGNLKLRMYLPMLTISVISVALFYDRLLSKKRTLSRI